METKIGVYKITFNNYDKFYIGSSVDLTRRKATHKSKLLSNSHCNKKLQNVFNKHGMFTFEVIENCSRDNLIEREQFFLDSLKPELNILDEAYNSIGFRHSEETKSKLKVINKEIVNRIEVKNKISKTWFKKGISKPMSEDTREKLKSINIGRKHQESSKIKMRESKLGKKMNYSTSIKLSQIKKNVPQKNWVPICRLDLDNNLLQIHPNIINACEFLNVTCSRYIRHSLNNKRESYKGYKWKYYNNEK